MGRHLNHQRIADFVKWIGIAVSLSSKLLILLIFVVTSMPDFAMLLFILKASGSVLAAEGKETESLDVNAQFIEGQVP